VPTFKGRELPHFGHAFSNLAHCPNAWQSSLTRVRLRYEVTPGYVKVGYEMSASRISLRFIVLLKCELNDKTAASNLHCSDKQPSITVAVLSAAAAGSRELV